MKKLFLIAGLLISLFSQGQRLGQPLGALNGLVYTRGSFMADQGLINSRLDTLNHPLKDSSGALTFWQNKLWLRVKPAWVAIGSVTAVSDGNNYPTTLSVTGITTKTITLTLLDGSIVTGSFDDNGGTGTVSNVSTNIGTGITGGPITTTGTLAIDTTKISTKASVTNTSNILQNNINSAITTILNKVQSDSTLLRNLINSISSGTVTSVATNTATGLNGGTITTSGTLYIDTTKISTRDNITKVKDSLLSVIGSSGGGTVLSVAKGIGIVKDGTITTTGTINADTTVLSTKNNVTNTSNILQGNITSTAITINNRITNDSTILRNLINANGNGTVTSIATNNATGIIGGTITNTGTLSLDTTIVSTKANVTNVTNGLQSQITANGAAITAETIRLTNDSTYLKGLIDSKLSSNQAITITATGDATGTSTSSPTAPSLPLVLATVNSNVGTFTNATVTVNAKGLVTAVATGSAGTTQTTAYQAVTTTAGQTVVTFTSVPSTRANYMIYRNGVYIDQSFFTPSGNSLTFVSGMSAGDVVSLHEIK